eukprot:GHVQ01005090.1.p1 GENE.GHVQ01005090.1~~GHVQ01005090.1.p1  ORF type:complete len:313 (-),score=27.83 GHVQ01005090.1:2014-2952(-)
MSTRTDTKFHTNNATISFSAEIILAVLVELSKRLQTRIYLSYALVSMQLSSASPDTLTNFDNVFLYEVLPKVTDVEVGRHKRRETCCNCQRAMVACYCSHLPVKSISIRCDLTPVIGRLIVYQHPRETKQAFNSVSVLDKCLDGIEYIVGRRPMPPENVMLPHCGEQSSISPAVVLLYQRKGHSLPFSSELLTHFPVVLICIDGTWNEAKEMYNSAKWLHDVQAFHLPLDNNNCSTSSQFDYDTSVFKRVRAPPEHLELTGAVCSAAAIVRMISLMCGAYGTCMDAARQLETSTLKALSRIADTQDFLKMKE